MKITAPIIALAALALIHAAPLDDTKQLQSMERRGSGALSESFIGAAVSKRHDAPAASFASFKKRDDDDNEGDDDDDHGGDDDEDGDEGGEHEEETPLKKRGDDGGRGANRRHCRRVCYKRCYPPYGDHKKRADDGELQANGKKRHCRYYCHWKCYGGGHH